MTLYIRPFQPDDLNAIYQICLQTGASGQDASDLFSDPLLLGAYYAAPYCTFSPEICFVVTKVQRVVGYIVGCQDSYQFAEQCEQEWFPRLRQQYPLATVRSNAAETKMVHLLHQGYTAASTYQDYPAHFHINLLPETQGSGIGKQLINTFINQLKSLQVTGLHLVVASENKRAIHFYEKIGFQAITSNEDSIGYALALTQAT